MQLEFQPRHYQIPIIKALNSGIKRAVWCVHRRGGKDVTAFNWCIFQLLLNPGWTAFHILPTYSQAKKVIWDSSTNDGKRILDYIPKELIESKNGQEMKIRFTNGSMFQLIGSDNIDSLVGSNPKIIIFSEYAIQSPAAWAYLSPILEVNGGYAIFISTPRGKNHFYELVKSARSNKNWFCEVLSVKDTNVLTDDQVKNIQIENGFSDEHMQQEYYCSFDRGVEGSYYGKDIAKAYQEKRICNVPYNTNSPVHTAWDLGWRDSTAITFWQDVGGECRIIDHVEANGEKMSYFAKILQNKPYVYGTHYVPHDAASEDAKSSSYQDVLYQLGIKTTVLKRESDIGPGIEAVRALIGIAFFDEQNCKHLIKCLENYHKKYNEKQEVYSDSPLHDWSSHSADSMRYLARARNEYGRGPGSMTKESLQQIKLRAGYGPKQIPLNQIGQISRSFGR